MRKMHRLFLNVIDIDISYTNYVSDADYNTVLIIGGTIVLCTALLAVVLSITVIVLRVSVRRLKAGVDDLKGEGIRQQ